MHRTCRPISCLAGQRAGGVALMFAVTALPIAGLIGIAVDLGLVNQAQAQLNAAADAAALAAAKAAADAFTAGQTDYIGTGKSAGEQWFASQSGQLIGASAQKPAVAVTQNGAVFASSVSYRGTATPYFGPLFGVGSVALSGLGSATITTTAYVSVTFLLDNSSSMLIAATEDGVSQLNAITPSYKGAVPAGLKGLACAFACHWDAGGNDYYGLAREKGITLRFDVLKSAVASTIQQMIAQQKITDQFSVGIYTFDTKPTAIYPAGGNQTTSTNLSGGISAAQGIVTPVVPDEANTNFPAVMSTLTAQSPAAGDGSAVTRPRRALIIVTDGLADYGSRSTPTSKGPINPANCAGMKNLGYNVFVLYTSYITTPADKLLPFDNIDLKAYIDGTKTPAMVPSLQACASAPANFAEASDPAAINTAMAKMLVAALGNGARFTD